MSLDGAQSHRATNSQSARRPPRKPATPHVLLLDLSAAATAAEPDKIKMPSDDVGVSRCGSDQERLLGVLTKCSLLIVLTVDKNVTVHSCNRTPIHTADATRLSS